jgi:hypothetical protein
MATNPTELKLSAYPPLYAEDPVDIDEETTLPTQNGNHWTHAQWLDALAAGECDCETLIRGVGDSIDANPEACWELPALVDQYYRRHRIKDTDFHNLNLLGQAPLSARGPSLRSAFRHRTEYHDTNQDFPTVHQRYQDTA